MSENRSRRKATSAALFVEERRRRAVEFINKKRQVTVSDLCAEFSVSGATMRGDLRELDEAGLVTRTHGGAMRRSHTGRESVIDARMSENREAKIAIARTAIEFIDNGDTLILDTGTTVLELAKLLNQRKGLTVVTNDMKIGETLERFGDCEIVFLGGQLRKGFHCTVGRGPYSFLSGLSVDKAFMGANSFNLARGASTPDLAQAEIKSKMVDAAAQVFVLCDNSKIETDSLVGFAQPEQVDVLVADLLPPEYRDRCENLGISVRTAN